MVQGTPFLLLLSLALVAPGLLARQCVLFGDWKNDLGSNMTIEAISEKGEFSGIYTTAVSDTPNKIQPSPLVGFQHSGAQNRQPTFGFTVQWTFSDSITVFTGQCFVDEEGKEVLKTMWLLRSHVDTMKDNWNATRVGTNTFTRLDSQERECQHRDTSAGCRARCVDTSPCPTTCFSQ